MMRAYMKYLFAVAALCVCLNSVAQDTKKQEEKGRGERTRGRRRRRKGRRGKKSVASFGKSPVGIISTDNKGSVSSALQ